MVSVKLMSSSSAFLVLVSGKRALEKVRGESFDGSSETVKKTAFKITRIGQLVGQMASRAPRCEI